MTTPPLLWGILFGSVGAGYCSYDRKQPALVQFGCGIALMGVPHFVSNAYLLVSVSAAIAAVPFDLKA